MFIESTETKANSETMYNTFAYILYLLLALVVVLIVGRILFRNGRFYLVEIMGEEHLADIINRFLFTGYCLVNAGAAFRCLHKTESFDSYLRVVEYVCVNQGQLLLLLGLMHAINMVVLPKLKPVFKSKTPAENRSAANK